MGFYFYRGGSTFDLGVPTHKPKKGVLKSRSSRGSGSMRLARLAGDGQGRCLVDGGATTSMRRAASAFPVEWLS